LYSIEADWRVLTAQGYDRWRGDALDLSACDERATAIFSKIFQKPPDRL
jgi:hypothetical protein